MKRLLLVLQQLAGILIIILIPLIIIMTSVRLLFNPLFLEVEYRMPGFPEDSYGFSLQDRLKWSKISLDYLFNSSDSTFLANQKFSDGTPLYNDRELSHMADVKKVVQSALDDWLIGIIVLFIFWLWSGRGGWWLDFRKSVSIGGWVTVGLILVVLTFIAINFSTLFTDFHKLFFTDNSWTFFYSDTLIRLFPMRLWQDSFIYLSILSLITGGCLAFFLGKPKK
jgi:integral membrane protein (TIGR01906 family)